MLLNIVFLHVLIFIVIIVLLLLMLEDASLLELSLGALDVLLFLLLSIIRLLLLVIVHGHILINAIFILVLDLFLVVLLIVNLVSGKFTLDHLGLIIVDELGSSVIHVLVRLLLFRTLTFLFFIRCHLGLINLLLVLIFLLLLMLLLLLFFLSLLLFLSFLKLLG